MLWKVETYQEQQISTLESRLHTTRQHNYNWGWRVGNHTEALPHHERRREDEGEVKNLCECCSRALQGGKHVGQAIRDLTNSSSRQKKCCGRDTGWESPMVVGLVDVMWWGHNTWCVDWRGVGVRARCSQPRQPRRRHVTSITCLDNTICLKNIQRVSFGKKQ